MRDTVICQPVRIPVGPYGGMLEDVPAHEVGTLVVLEHGALAVAYNRRQPEPARACERFAGGERFYRPSAG